MGLYQHHLEIPKELLKKDYGFSMDFGGSLIKVIYIGQEDIDNPKKNQVKLHFVTFLLENIEEALTFIKDNVRYQAGETYTFTGLGSAIKRQLIENELNINVSGAFELECITRAFHFFKTKLSEDKYIYPRIDDSFAQKQENEMTIIMNKFTQAGIGQVDDVKNGTVEDCTDSNKSEMIYVLGSAAFFLKINPDGTHSFLHTNPTCGQSLLGLGRLLADAKTFEELMSLASSGDYRNIHKTGSDLKAVEAGDDGDVYADIFDDIVCYNFGKTYKESRDSFRTEDLAHGLITCLMDQLAQLGYVMCQLHHIKKIHIIGGMAENELVRTEFLRSWARQTGLFRKPVEVQFVKYSGYLGALGALFREV